MIYSCKPQLLDSVTEHNRNVLLALGTGYENCFPHTEWQVALLQVVLWEPVL